MSQITEQEAAEHIATRRKEGVKFSEIVEELKTLGFELPNGGDINNQSLERFLTAHNPGWGNKRLIERLDELYSKLVHPNRITKILEEEGFTNPRGMPIGLATVKLWRTKIKPDLAHKRHSSRVRLAKKAQRKQKQLEFATPKGQEPVRQERNPITDCSGQILLANKILNAPTLTDADKTTILKGIFG